MESSAAQPGGLSQFEEDALRALLAGSGTVLAGLRRQLAFAHVTERTYSGVGVFTTIRVPDELAVDELRARRRAWIADVSAVDVPGVQRGIGFVLFVEHGRLATLEAFTFGDEAWPRAVEKYRFEYDATGAGDLVTPGTRALS